LRNGALGAQRIPGHHPPCEHHLPQQIHDHGNLIGLVRHRVLGQDEAEPMPQRGQQMRPRGALLLAPTQGLAIDGESF
jgi:hypothetical protein